MPSLTEPVRPPGTMAALPQPRLTVDDHLVLRLWRHTDVAAVLAAFADPDIQHWHARRLDGPDEAAEWISSWAPGWAAETGASWAVARIADDRAVGQVGLRAVSLAEGHAAVSYWVLPSVRRTGVAVRATDSMARWAFGVLGLHRLSLVHSTANRASCRVALATGFSSEGTMRDRLLHADGWHDAHLHARLGSDPRSA